jgi:predicted RNA-binding protein YlqC (UPF0109 family)
LETEGLESLLTYLVQALVEQKDQVQLKRSESEGVWLYELKVAPSDIGKVIGRDGRTVNAVRTLLSAAAQKRGQRAKLEILDDRRPPPAPAARMEIEPESP